MDVSNIRAQPVKKISGSEKDITAKECNDLGFHVSPPSTGTSKEKAASENNRGSHEGTSIFLEKEILYGGTEKKDFSSK